MKFTQGLQEGLFLKRYKRFFADVQIPGFAEVQVVHVANTGSLKSVLAANRPCLLSPAANPERKLRWSLEALQADDGSWIGINTSWPNKLGLELFTDKKLKHWTQYSDIQSEVKINEKTRLDLCLTAKDKKHFVEIKNVTLREGNQLRFPDAVTERGQKHLEELMQLQKKGFGAEILFIAQRTDCDCFSPAVDIDPDYAKLLAKAVKQGVLVTALSFAISKDGLHLEKNLRIEI